MTREQALNYLYSSGFSEGQVNAVVEALEQDCDKCEYANPCLYCKHEFSLTSTDEPMTKVYPTIFCGDTISRSEAIDQMEQSYNILDATDRIKALPSVQAVCGDTISLADAKEIIARNDSTNGKIAVFTGKQVQQMLDSLPRIVTKPIECEDAISREAVLNLLDKERDEYTIQNVKALPKSLIKIGGTHHIRKAVRND